MRDAVNICINKIGDIHLAITIIRAYEGDDGPTLQEVLEERVLVSSSRRSAMVDFPWSIWAMIEKFLMFLRLYSCIDPKNIEQSG